MSSESIPSPASGPLFVLLFFLPVAVGAASESLRSIEAHLLLLGRYYARDKLNSSSSFDNLSNELPLNLPVRLSGTCNLKFGSRLGTYNRPLRAARPGSSVNRREHPASARLPVPSTHVRDGPGAAAAALNGPETTPGSPSR
jgi:hypothetical protein